jgi:hypothetical protein
MSMLRKTLALLLLLTMITVMGNASNIINASPDSNSPGTVIWSRIYSGNYPEEARSMVQTSDGGYAITGYIFSVGIGEPNALLVKTDSEGNQVWNKTFSEGANCVIQTSDGGYALAGISDSSGDGWLVKTDSGGNQLWSKTYGGDRSDEVFSLIQTNDGGYALAGYTVSDAVGENIWLVKTDSAGNQLWSKTYGGGVAFSLIQTNDGGYALAGDGFSLVKTDSAGNQQWSKDYVDGGAAFSLIKTSDGGYALAGSSYSNFTLVKTDSAGNQLWSKGYGAINDEENHFKKDNGIWSVIQTNDGGFALAGNSATSYSTWTGQAAWLVKTDSAGNQQWSKDYGSIGGDAHCIVQTTESDKYVLAGYAFSDNDTPKGFWLVKVVGGSAVPTVLPSPSNKSTPTPIPTVSIISMNPQSLVVISVVPTAIAICVGLIVYKRYWSAVKSRKLLVLQIITCLAIVAIALPSAFLVHETTATGTQYVDDFGDGHVLDFNLQKGQNVSGVVDFGYLTDDSIYVNGPEHVEKLTSWGPNATMTTIGWEGIFMTIKGTLEDDLVGTISFTAPQDGEWSIYMATHAHTRMPHTVHYSYSITEPTVFGFNHWTFTALVIALGAILELIFCLPIVFFARRPHIPSNSLVKKP